MAESAASLIRRTRRYLRDYPDQDALTASVGSSGTTLTVADSSLYTVGWAVEVDNETAIVRAKPTGTTLTVERAAYGSTADTHASGSAVLIRPAFYTVEILDALNAAVQACYPLIYQEVLDTSLSVVSGQYEYDVPDMPGTYGGDTIPIPRIHTVEIQDSTTVPFIPLRSWNVKRGAAPKIKLTYLEAANSTLRIHGYGPFPDLALADSLHTQWPKNFVQPLVEMAVSMLTASGEAGRARMDVGARDDREAANKPGVSLQVATALEGRFVRRLASVALPPMQPHIVTNGE